MRMEPLYRKHLNLRTAPLPELLTYGLTLDPDDPVLGTVIAVQQELKLIAHLLLSSPPVSEFAEADLSATLELLARRLEIVVEQMRRAQVGNDATTVRDAGKADPSGGQ